MYFYTKLWVLGGRVITRIKGVAYRRQSRHFRRKKKRFSINLKILKCTYQILSFPIVITSIIGPIVRKNILCTYRAGQLYCFRVCNRTTKIPQHIQKKTLTVLWRAYFFFFFSHHKYNKWLGSAIGKKKKNTLQVTTQIKVFLICG